MSITTEIKRHKVNLINRAKRKGLYENFGQKEVAKLKFKFDYQSLVYGTEKERQKAKLIDNFDNWCMNYNLN